MYYMDPFLRKNISIENIIFMVFHLASKRVEIFSLKKDVPINGVINILYNLKKKYLYCIYVIQLSAMFSMFYVL